MKHPLEKEIRRLLAEGLSQRKVASALGVSRGTVRYYGGEMEECKERSRAYYEANKSACKRTQKGYRASKPVAVRISKANYRAAKIGAMPCWLTDEQRRQIAAIYRKARRLSRETGVEHHVDHIHPLRGETVCGLHVPWNLQILTESENCAKSNNLVD